MQKLHFLTLLVLCADSVRLGEQTATHERFVRYEDRLHR